jgi:hypothetical protein
MVYVVKLSRNEEPEIHKSKAHSNKEIPGNFDLLEKSFKKFFGNN